MKAIKLFGLMFALSIGTGAAAVEDSVMKELVPTGKLRFAIAVSLAPSALYVIKGASGGYRGVAIDLGSALAQKLGVSVEFVPYLASGAITADAKSDVWDVTFMPVDEERKKAVAFGNAYHLLQSTYLVAPGSAIKTLADANAAGVRIAGAAGTATFRASNKASPKATHVEVAGVDAAVCYYPGGIEGQLGQVDKVKCPIMFHFAQNDDHISMDAVAAVKTAFAGKSNATVEVYPSVDHGFNCWARGTYQQKAAALARGRTLQFLAQNL